MEQYEIDRIDVARHLLPAPGDEVVGQLISEIRLLRNELNTTKSELERMKQNK